MPGGERNEFHIEFDFLRQGFEYHWDSSKRHRFVYRLCIRLRVRYFMERERKDDFPLSLPSFHSFLFAHLYSFFLFLFSLKNMGWCSDFRYVRTICIWNPWKTRLARHRMDVWSYRLTIAIYGWSKTFTAWISFKNGTTFVRKISTL